MLMKDKIIEKLGNESKGLSLIEINVFKEKIIDIQILEQV